MGRVKKILKWMGKEAAKVLMAFELAVTDGDPDKCAIETRRAIALIDAKENPTEFIRQIIEKARQYEQDI